jgi:hypothetical protein
MAGLKSERFKLAFRAAGVLGTTLSLFVAIPAAAEKVGVAAAVNPDAFSSLSGAPTDQLNIGKSIFFNERIKTTDSGLVQVLLVDGSTFTVGPGSDLLIDKFVYNPKKGTGEIATTFSKGVVRYVGGKISKNDDAVKMKTPAGAVAIRGGMFQAKINSSGKGIFSFLHGVGLTFSGKNGETFKVFQPGYTLDLTSSTPKIRPTTAADTNVIMTAFAKGGSGTGTAATSGVGGTKPNNTNGNTVQASNTISEIINTFTQSQIQTALDEEVGDQVQNPTPTPTPNTGAPQREPPGPPPPPPPPPNPGGYAAGIVLSDQPVPFANVVMSQSTQDFLLNDGSATMTLHDVDAFDGATSQYSFAGLTNIEGLLTASVSDNAGAAYSQASATGHIAPNSQPEFSLCDDCDFMEWGSFQTQVTFSNGADSTEYVDRIDGWWVSGNLTSVSELNALDVLGATATYNGRAIGTVLLQDGAYRNTYTATGDLLMFWSFRDRQGNLTISNFDGRTFGTLPSGLTQPNRALNQFGGTLTAEGLNGQAIGSFVRGPSSAAQGVIGNWRIGGGGYSATGIFGGVQTPATQ